MLVLLLAHHNLHSSCECVAPVKLIQQGMNVALQDKCTDYHILCYWTLINADGRRLFEDSAEKKTESAFICVPILRM